MQSFDDAAERVGEIVAERLEWAPADGCEALQLDLAAYFREVRGEKG